MTQKIKNRENLNINKNVLVLAERIRKKSGLRKFLQTICSKYILLYQKKFFIRKKEKIDKISYYWLKDSQNKKLTRRFQSTEL